MEGEEIEAHKWISKIATANHLLVLYAVHNLNIMRLYELYFAIRAL